MMYVVSIGLVVAVLGIIGKLNTYGALWLLLLVPFFTLFNLTLAVIVAYLFVFFRDIRPIVDMGTFVLFYGTPIFYKVDMVPTNWEWVFLANPLALFVELHRVVLLQGYESVLPVSAGVLLWFAGISAAATLEIGLVPAASLQPETGRRYTLHECRLRALRAFG